jgi:hypothetical protein
MEPNAEEPAGQGSFDRPSIPVIELVNIHKGSCLSTDIQRRTRLGICRGCNNQNLQKVTSSRPIYVWLLLCFAALNAHSIPM